MAHITYPAAAAPTVIVLDGEHNPAYYLDRDAQPQWTHDDCVNYESARELITELMAFRSEWIARERAKAEPDLPVIERWKAERGAYAAELRGLDVTDRENITRIRRDYGAEVRRLAAEA
ncbi:hypothetical protein [Denitromonas sp.]|uniref:hypothetical protein n=1 Tax=Denitromonas sp. TaxID=2734609 RepID=UPI002AFF2692|nr:hypothetical protein [Denitromonas sp.]